MSTPTPHSMSNPDLGVYGDPDSGFSVPNGTAKLAAVSEPPAPTMTDKLQADAQVNVPDWPPGAPELRPLMRLPFDERADAFARFAEVQALGDLAQLKEGEQASASKIAQMYRAYAKLDSFLRTVAVDPGEYERWDGRWDDERFGKLWSAYQARMTPGEASRSSS